LDGLQRITAGMKQKNITMRELAQAAGVSTATVSLALRDDHRIAPATRRRIRELADQKGYRRDPVVARMMAQLPKKRRGHSPVLAFVTDHPRPFRELGGNHDIRCWHGAERQAGTMGYELQEFRLSKEMSAAQLSRILWTRGIEGVLIGPLVEPDTRIGLAWDRFAAVALGHSLNAPRLDCVSNDQFNSGTLAFQSLYGRGYRRMGLLHTGEIERRVRYAWEASYFMACRRHGIPACATPEEVKIDRDLLDWIEQNRVDVLMIPSMGHLADLAPQVQRLCHLASLHLHPRDQGVSGIDQQWEALGGQAVNLLISRIHAGQSGVPLFPVTVCGEGRWVDGSTA